MNNTARITLLPPSLLKSGDCQVIPKRDDKKLSSRVTHLRRRIDLVSRGEIATHLSGARNDTNNRVLPSYRGIWLNNNNGITLIELVVTVSIIAILVFALGFEYRNWMGRYKAENQMKEMYIDLMNARARAMERNRIHFVTGTANQYTVYEDTSPGPDGNGTLEVDSDDRLPTYPKNVEYAMTWTGPGTQIDFDRRGLMSPSGSIYLTSSTDPAVGANRDYDCIEISQTRINMGKWDAAATTCVEK